MTDEELFTAVYLVCGILPSEPEKQKSVLHLATMYRRKLPGGKEMMWLVDDELDAASLIDTRAYSDPAYIEYFSKAAPLGMTLMKFGDYIRWVEARSEDR